MTIQDIKNKLSGVPLDNKKINSKYYDSAGNIIWPVNQGFAGTPVVKVLEPGTRIDRYGYESGRYVSPAGTPYEQRALAPGTEKKPYKVYEIVKPVEVQAGKIAPWFDEPGGGTQYVFDESIADLLEKGILKEVK